MYLLNIKIVNFTTLFSYIILIKEGILPTVHYTVKHRILFNHWIRYFGLAHLFYFSLVMNIAYMYMKSTVLLKYPKI